jgi:hypothetical protein
VAASAIIVGCTELDQQAVIATDDFPRIYRGKSRSHRVVGVPERALLTARLKWGIVGLIHDFDYDRWPSLEDHPYKGNEILKERGWPEVITRAVMSHAEYTGVTRDTPMEKALFELGLDGRAAQTD